MSGFVRAVAVAEPSLLAAPSSGRSAMAVIDEARRHGTKMILLSDRSLADLHRSGAGLLAHFDGVVAARGSELMAPHRVDPAARPRRSRRDALLEVLHDLDVDPHDALGVSADVRDVDLLDTLEVAVVVTDQERAEPKGTDYRLAGPESLDRLLQLLVNGEPAVSPHRHDVHLRWERPAGAITVDLPGAHANVLICAAGPGTADVPAGLVGQWSAAGYQVAVLDLTGARAWVRHGLSPGEAGRPATVLRVEAGAQFWRHDVIATLDAGTGCEPLIVDLSGAASPARSAAVGTVLSQLRDHRARTGRPHWLLIDGAERVLRDPDIPPEALDLSQRGHCLVLRDHTGLATAIGGLADAALPCAPSCPVPARQI